MKTGPLLSSLRRQSITWGKALATLVLLVIGGLVSPATAAIIDQPMTGATAPGWVIGGAAYLSASTGVDAPGDGWLRLTEPTGNQSGFAMYDSAFDISSGVVIQFDYATWGGNGADGYSIYLFDGAYNAATFQVGASGGSLGYDKKTVAPVAPGITGGYIGVGIDEYGNFSNPTEGRLGGPGLLQNSVSVRGPFDHPTGAYYYIGGTAANVGALWFNQAFRPGQTGSQYRKVVIYLTPVAAPEYMRVDVFMQFGYNQPLTYLINTLYTMRPIPSTVKVGYAASTGGSTNYHEIRNLVIDNLPVDINLAIAKSASVPIVAPGGALTYTVTARNYGPNLVTVANNVPIIDTLPVQLTGATWTCAASGGGNCDVASGSGNLNTTADLPFNGAATYTITGTVAAGTPLGTVVNNTATLSAPVGITDYNPADNSASIATTVSNGTISIAGTVYSDSGTGGGIAHNGVRDGTEAGVNAGLTYYAKLFRASDLTTTVVAPVTVNAATGAYSFAGVPSYGDYVVILSSTNTANVYDPSFPSANWIYVTPLNYILSGVAASGANLTNRNFFVYNGSRVAGKVIKDDGFNGSISTAYDGILNAAETGIAGVGMALRNTGGTTYDTATTDANGNFVLYTNTPSTTLRIYETNLAGYTSVSYNIGTTAGAYTIGGEYIQFAYALGTDYSNVLFGDLPPPITISFTPTPQSASGRSIAPVYYAHTFSATARGSVSFAMNSRTQGGWPAVAYVRDSNCNGSFDAGEPDIVAAISAEAGQNVCILLRETIPVGAAVGATDQVITRATFTTGLASQTSDVTDTTTVANFPALTATKSWIDPGGGDQDPNDTIRYTITLTETNNIAAGSVSVTDTIDTNFDTFASSSIPAGAVDSSTVGTGPLNVTGITVPANGSVSIVYTVKIKNGTAAGTSIPNIADFINPGGSNGTATAPNVIVSGSALPASGNKPLYLYDGASAPAYKLSRLPMGVNAASFVAIPRGGNTQTWTLSQALQSAVTISSGTISGELWLATNSNRNYNIPVTLACGATSVATVTLNNTALTGTVISVPFSLPLAADYICPAGSAWSLSVTNTQGTGGALRDIRVYPAPATASYSNVTLPSEDVINVDTITFYDAAYPLGNLMTTVTPGETVYIRAVVSDPFGSYDINPAIGGTRPTVTISNPSGATEQPATAMNELGTLTPLTLPTTLATKTFEYPYLVPALGLEGNWTVRVDAFEGTETPSVTDYGLATLLVARPSLLVVKLAQTFSDPINDQASPKAIPGAFVDYTIIVTNSGRGRATNDTTVITDPIPANTELFVGDITGVVGTGPVLFTNGATVSGLSYAFTSLASITDNLAFSGNNGVDNYLKSPAATPDVNGCDPTVTNIKVPLSGIFNGSDGTNHPSFSIKFRVRIK